MTFPESPPKVCEHCSTLFTKPSTVSRAYWTLTRFCSAACKKANQTGKPNGKLGWRQPVSKAKFIPCRICGEPTKYKGTENHPSYNLLRCEKPECIEESKRRKNEAIKKKHLKDYASGKRALLPSDNWRSHDRYSPIEGLLKDWFEGIGWQHNYKYVPGVKGKDSPRTYWLDFAEPNKKLCVEIDGSVHNKKHIQAKDERRDQIMHERGWRILRIPSSLVHDNIDSAIALIRTTFL